MESPKNTTDQVTGANASGRQPASPVRPNAPAKRTAQRVNKGVAVVNGLLRLVPTAFFAWAAILCLTHGVYVGLLFLLAAAYYGWRALGWFML